MANEAGIELFQDVLDTKLCKEQHSALASEAIQFMKQGLKVFDLMRCLQLCFPNHGVIPNLKLLKMVH